MGEPATRFGDIPPTQPNWHPVATCPIGHYVMLWCGFHVIGYQFDRGKFSEHHARSRHEIFHVTHWSPLQDGPEGSD